ncbi:hypothetical protein PUNSTDRAFT_56906 [Punctularia strigosozonata HHB-11173 SS5]|uniref:uncharacterized protein n=1 Tax=Punctularia strigosozonata (strain HHB-11173) TaxID=741275 RepID=UPI000441643C|nr:uncharacterized protein PUNSTDRAFT_56906 [Punctularia strigosozonata HHB-11173 SS5]EIN13604.1 hypothetical protein PUNSTDRAFT_56906 [Punctularia strigosozonata HHB-11173 SS5]
MYGFQAAEPDFVIRSIPDGTDFAVEKRCLVSGSQVFHDMFSSCLSEGEQLLNIDETSSTLSLLLRVLHDPPPLLLTGHAAIHDGPREASEEIVIPFPLLPILLHLADKYALLEPSLAVIRSHLAAYSASFPLQVYGHAVRMGWRSVAADASEFLLHPLTTYSAEDVAIIPTADAYHQLVVLQETRRKALKQFLLGEELFPHGYGFCTRHGAQMTMQWNHMKAQLYEQVEATTNVPLGMGSITSAVGNCPHCRKACEAALEMLAYKCRKAPRKIDYADEDD